jgi:Methyltransferase domain
VVSFDERGYTNPYDNVRNASIKALGKTRSDLDLLAGTLLTAQIGLTGQVIFHHGHALDLPFADGSFDLVWTQNSGMQIADKGRLNRGFFRAHGTFGVLFVPKPYCDLFLRNQTA